MAVSSYAVADCWERLRTASIEAPAKSNELTARAPKITSPLTMPTTNRSTAITIKIFMLHFLELVARITGAGWLGLAPAKRTIYGWCQACRRGYPFTQSCLFFYSSANQSMYTSLNNEFTDASCWISVRPTGTLYKSYGWIPLEDYFYDPRSSRGQLVFL